MSRAHRPLPSSASRRGMTLMELLCVMLLVSVFAALVFPGIAALERSGKRRQAAGTSTSLVLAIEQYRTRYGRWPLLTQNEDADVIYAPDDDTCSVSSGTLVEQAELIGALTTNRTENPLLHRFIEVESDNIKDGRLVDPWGRPYIVLVDADADRLIQISAEHESAGELTLATNATVIALSWGESPGNAVYSHSTN